MWNSLVAKYLMPRSASGYSYDELREQGFTRLAAPGRPTWWLKKASHEEGVLVFFHGNAETAADWVILPELYPELEGWSFVLAEYRGYANPVVPLSRSEKELVDDALHGLGRVRNRVGDVPVVLWGRSLGGAVAAQVASQADVDGLILESTFCELADVVKSMLPLPVPRPLLRLIVRRFSLRTEAAVTERTCRLLVAHSKSDEIIPLDHAARIYEAASEPKSLHWFRGGHNHEKSGQARFRSAVSELCVSATDFHCNGNLTPAV